jgi:hypothetical protein
MGSVRYKVEDDVVKEIHKVVVHTFTMGGVEDPDIYAAGPMFDWERSEAGQFVFKHAVDKPEWHRSMDYNTVGYLYIIVAELEKKKLSEFYLRWGKDGSGKIR